MIKKEFAYEFAKEWIASWNAHDIDRVLLKYTEDFTIESPRALEVDPASGGRIMGKAGVRNYWQASMKLRPGLHFELLDIFLGINSITIYYLNAVTNKRAVEMLRFDEGLNVSSVTVNYTP
jgi:hypothetical protein